jgi:lipopolysaccharide/colanic/teichoic acid biosynthesis glycosyltransferase
MQRIFDVILSFTALVILAPLLLPILIVLRVTGEKEIFYVQDRIGYGGVKFGLVKFATMLKNSPNIGAGDITVSGDTRVLPFGKFLRKTKLNELPQLWNIFIGDMSIVGPRPMVPNIYANYTTQARDRLNMIRPGLTGIGSIIFRDEECYLIDEDNPMDFYIDIIIPYKSDLEIWFVDNQSLWLYFKIIFITAWVVIFPNSKISKFGLKNIPSLPKKLRLKKIRN